MPEREEPELGSPAAFGAQVVPPLVGHEQAVRSVVGGLVRERPVAVTGSDDRTVRVWDMLTHRQLGGPLTAPDVDTVHEVVYVPDGGRSLAVGVGHALWVWDLTSGRQVGAGRPPRSYSPRFPTGGWLQSVACSRLDGRLIAVTGGFDVRVWDLLAQVELGEPLPESRDTDWIKSVACATVAGRAVAVGAHEAGPVLVWDLVRRERVGPALPGRAPARVGVLDGVPVVVAAIGERHDGRLQAWRLDTFAPVGPPMVGHAGEVGAVTFGRAGGQPVVISGGHDHTVRVWDPYTGRPLGAPLRDGRDDHWIDSLAFGTLAGRPTVLAAAGTRVRVWDLDAHRRLGARMPTRFATELPTSWTDPQTGDVYDLSGPLFDDDGDEWEYVDFDGFEPIVSQHPVNLECTFGIRDAHEQYVFDNVVTPGPRRPQEPVDVVHSPYRRFYELRILTDRTLSEADVAALRRQHPTARITPTSLVLDIDGGEVELDEFDDDPPEHGLLTDKIDWLGDKELDRMLRDYRFDVALDFYGGGDRSVTFRLTTSDVRVAALTPYLVKEAYGGGLSVEQVHDDVLVRLTNGEVDGHLAYYRENPDTWLEPLLPIYTDLAGGDLSVAYLGWLKAVEDRRDRDRLAAPPKPPGWHGVTPALDRLATFLRLGDWARAHLASPRSGDRKHPFGSPSKS
jgi:WD40 repeat protein